MQNRFKFNHGAVHFQSEGVSILSSFCKTWLWWYRCTTNIGFSLRCLLDIWTLEDADIVAHSFTFIRFRSGCRRNWLTDASCCNQNFRIQFCPKATRISRQVLTNNQNIINLWAEAVREHAEGCCNVTSFYFQPTWHQLIRRINSVP